MAGSGSDIGAISGAVLWWRLQTEFTDWCSLLSSKATERPAAHLPTRKLLQRLVRDHVSPHAGRVALAVVCMVGVAASTATYAWLMEPVLNQVFLEKDRAMLYLMPAAVLIVFLVKGISVYGQAVLMNTIGQRIVADLQVRLFEHHARADLAFLHECGTGRLVSGLTHDVNLLRGAVSNAMTGLVKESLTVAFLVAVMFYQDWLLAMVAFFVFPMALLPIVKIGRRLRKVSAKTQARLGDLTAFLEQSFLGARLVKAYGMEEAETGRAGRIVEDLYRLITRAMRVRAASTPIMESLGGVAIAIVILYGGANVISGVTTTGAFFSFITALLLAYQPMKNLANLNNRLQEGLAAAQRIFARLDAEPTIRDRAGAQPLVVQGGAIRFAEVVFAYHAGVPALQGLSLEVPAGKTVALVGPSGAGKSTVLNLIPRFYDVDGGAVTIDGVDVRDVSLKSLRGAIALVLQEASLFNDTVRANIAFGRPGANGDEIKAATRAAAAHEFVAALPNGYDSVVGEHGVKLSGGQRQRIAIARAMLRDAPILLLDEATSALDSESERLVQDALSKLTKGRTTLVIAHRLSTILNADLIYFISDGRAVEAGTHGELLARNGAYARLYQLQFAESGDQARRARA